MDVTSDKICVVVRVRPLIKREQPDHVQWKTEDLTKICHLDQNGASFTYDRVFDTHENTVAVYNSVVQKIVLAAMNGFNGTIFAYGQTSSGKTYTMMGNDREGGVIQLAISEIFNNIENNPDREYLIRVRYLEIYNENLTDLLLEQGKKAELRICENETGSVSVSGANEAVVQDSQQIMQLLRRGEKRRRYGETNMNERSSRSHTIFSIIIESRSRDVDELMGACNVAHLNMVDLAGSERASETGAIGDRLKEGCKINASLFQLSHVISQISEGEKHVNFRNSKLTRLLQSSIGGNAHTAVICNVTPANNSQTLSTLQFASRAKTIRTKAFQNEVVSDEAMLKRYRKQIELLRDQMRKMEEGDAAFGEAVVLQQKLAESQQNSAEHLRQLEERDQWLAESQEKIRRLEKMLCVSSLSRPVAEKGVKRKLRRETWCVGKSGVLPYTPPRLPLLKEKFGNFDDIIEEESEDDADEERIPKKAKRAVTFDDDVAQDVSVFVPKPENQIVHNELEEQRISQLEQDLAEAQAAKHGLMEQLETERKRRFDEQSEAARKLSLLQESQHQQSTNLAAEIDLAEKNAMIDHYKNQLQQQSDTFKNEIEERDRKINELQQTVSAIPADKTTKLLGGTNAGTQTVAVSNQPDSVPTTSSGRVDLQARRSFIVNRRSMPSDQLNARIELAKKEETAEKLRMQLYEKITENKELADQKEDLERRLKEAEIVLEQNVGQQADDCEKLRKQLEEQAKYIDSIEKEKDFLENKKLQLELSYEELREFTRLEQECEVDEQVANLQKELDLAREQIKEVGSLRDKLSSFQQEIKNVNATRAAEEELLSLQNEKLQAKVKQLQKEKELFQMNAEAHSTTEYPEKKTLTDSSEVLLDLMSLFNWNVSSSAEQLPSLETIKSHLKTIKDENEQLKTKLKAITDEQPTISFVPSKTDVGTQMHEFVQQDGMLDVGIAIDEQKAAESDNVLVEQLTDANMKITELTCQVNELMEKNEDLLTQTAEAGESNERLGAKISEITNKYDNVVMKNEQLSIEINEISHEYAKLCCRNEELCFEVKTISGMYDDIVKQLSDFKARRESLVLSEYETCICDEEDAGDILAVCRSLINHVAEEDQPVSMDLVVVDTAHGSEEQKKKCAENSEHVIDLLTENDQLSKQITDLTKENKLLFEQIEHVTSTCKSLSNQLDDLNIKKSALDYQVQRMADCNNELSNQIEELVNKNGLLSIQEQDGKKAKEEYTKQIEDIARNNYILITKKEALVCKTEELSTFIKEKTQLNETLALQLEDLQTKNLELLCQIENDNRNVPFEQKRTYSDNAANTNEQRNLSLWTLGNINNAENTDKSKLNCCDEFHDAQELACEEMPSEMTVQNNEIVVGETMAVELTDLVKKSDDKVIICEVLSALVEKASVMAHPPEQCAHLVAEVERLKNVNQELSNEIQELNRRIEERARNEEDVEEVNIDEQLEDDEQFEDVDINEELRERLNMQDKQIDDMLTEAREVNNFVQRVSEYVASLDLPRQRGQVAHYLTALLKQCNEHAQSFRDQEEYERLSLQIAELTSINEEASLIVKELTEKNEQLLSEKEVLVLGKEELVSQIASIKDENEMLFTRCTEATVRNQELLEECRQVSDKNADLTARMEVLVAKNEKLFKEALENPVISARLEKMSCQNEELAEQVVQLKKRNDELALQLQGFDQGNKFLSEGLFSEMDLVPDPDTSIMTNALDIETNKFLSKQDLHQGKRLTVSQDETVDVDTEYAANKCVFEADDHTMFVVKNKEVVTDCANLMKENEKLKKLSEDLADQTELLRSDVDTLTEQNNALIEQNEKLRDAASCVLSLDHDISSLRSQLDGTDVESVQEGCKNLNAEGALSSKLDKTVAWHDNKDTAIVVDDLRRKVGELDAQLQSEYDRRRKAEAEYATLQYQFEVELADVSELKMSKEALEMKFQSMEESCTAHVSQLQITEKQLQEAVDKCKEFEAQLSELQIRYDDRLAEVDNQQEKLKSLELEYEAAVTNKSAVQTGLKERIATLENAEKELKDANVAQRNQFETDMEEMCDARTRLEAEITALKESRDNTYKVVELQETAMAKLREEKCLLQKQVDAEMLVEENLEKDLTSVREELNHEKEQNEQRTLRFANLEQVMSTLREELKVVEAAKEELLSLVDDKDQQLKAAEDEKNALRENIAKLNSDIDELTRKLGVEVELRNSAEEMVDRLKGTYDEIDTANEEVETLKRENLKLENQLNCFREQLDTLRTLVEERNNLMKAVEVEKAGLQEQVETLNERIKQLGKQLSNETGKCGNLEKQNKELLAACNEFADAEEQINKLKFKIHEQEKQIEVPDKAEGKNNDVVQSDNSQKLPDENEWHMHIEKYANLKEDLQQARVDLKREGERATAALQESDSLRIELENFSQKCEFLQVDADHLTEACNDLNNEIEEEKQSARKARAERDEAIKQAKDLTEELAKFKQTGTKCSVAVESEESQKLCAENKQLMQKLASLDENLQQARSALNKETDQARAAVSECNHLRLELAKASKMCECLQADVDRLTEACNDVDDEIEEEKQSARRARAERDEAIKQAKDLTEELEKFKQSGTKCSIAVQSEESQKLYAENKQLMQKLANLDENVQQARSALNKETDRARAAVSECDNLRSELAKASQLCQCLQADVDRLTEACNDVDNEIEEEKQSARRARQERDRSVEQIQKLSKELEKSKQEAKKLSEELEKSNHDELEKKQVADNKAALEHKIAKLTAEVKNSWHEHEKTKKELAKAKESIEHETDRCRDYRTQLRKVNQTLDSAVKSEAEAKKKLADVEKQLNALQFELDSLRSGSAQSQSSSEMELPRVSYGRGGSGIVSECLVLTLENRVYNLNKEMNVLRQKLEESEKERKRREEQVHKLRAYIKQDMAKKERASQPLQGMTNSPRKDVAKRSSSTTSYLQAPGDTASIIENDSNMSSSNQEVFAKKSDHVPSDCKQQ